MTADVGAAGEEALRALDAMLDYVCERHGLEGTPAAQFRFVAAVHLLGTVAQRAGLSKEYTLARIAEMVPRAMDASEGDEHIDIHRGGVPS